MKWGSLVPVSEGSRIYRTGDLAKFIADGVVVFRSPQSGFIKIQGLLVEERTRSQLADEMHNRLSEILPSYMIPSVLIPVEKLPLTTLKKSIDSDFEAIYPR